MTDIFSDSDYEWDSDELDFFDKSNEEIPKSDSDRVDNATEKNRQEQDIISRREAEEKAKLINYLYFIDSQGQFCSIDDETHTVTEHENTCSIITNGDGFVDEAGIFVDTFKSDNEDLMWPRRQFMKLINEGAPIMDVIDFEVENRFHGYSLKCFLTHRDDNSLALFSTLPDHPKITLGENIKNIHYPNFQIANTQEGHIIGIWAVTEDHDIINFKIEIKYRKPVQSVYRYVFDFVSQTSEIIKFHLPVKDIIISLAYTEDYNLSYMKRVELCAAKYLCLLIITESNEIYNRPFDVDLVSDTVLLSLPTTTVVSYSMLPMGNVLLLLTEDGKVYKQTIIAGKCKQLKQLNYENITQIVHVLDYVMLLDINGVMKIFKDDIIVASVENVRALPYHKVEQINYIKSARS